MTWRRLVALIERLPVEAATVQQETGHQWDVTQHLIASLIDAVNLNTWAVQSTASTKRVPRPKPIERPNHKRNRRGNAAYSIAEMRQLLDNWSDLPTRDVEPLILKGGPDGR